jgi:hypothetical protein
MCSRDLARLAMSQQLELPAVSDADAWAEILDCVRDIVRARGNKDMAYALDVSPSDLSHALAERNRFELKLRYLPALLRLRHNDDLPQAIARAAGLELAPARPLTAAEQLERIQAALGRAGAAGAAILDDAYGRRR